MRQKAKILDYAYVCARCTLPIARLATLEATATTSLPANRLNSFQTALQGDDNFHRLQAIKIINIATLLRNRPEAPASSAWQRTG